MNASPARVVLAYDDVLLREGLEAARVIQRDFPEVAVVVLSAHVEVEHAMDLLASGRHTGYLLKSRVTDIAEFVDTLRRVQRGGTVERRDRTGLVGDGRNGRKARAEHLDEVAAPGDRRGTPPGPGRARLPGSALNPIPR